MALRRQESAEISVPRAVRIFAANERMNQLAIERLDPAAWRATPPGGVRGVRTIAAIFTHVHNVRSKWVRLTAPHLKVPAQLNRARCPRGAGRERFPLRGDARRGIWRPDRELSPGRMGAAVAGWAGDALLHGRARGAPSRAGADARASARIAAAARGGGWDLELGEAMEEWRLDLFTLRRSAAKG